MLAAFAAAMMIGGSPVAPAAPLHRVGEKDWFHVPGVQDFRLQKIARSGNEAGWPFTIDEGYLLCAYVLAQRVVYFAPIPAEGKTATTALVMVSSNPFDLAFGNMPARHLVRQDLSLERLIGLMGSFETVGRRLCDQPPGSNIGSGEL